MAYTYRRPLGVEKPCLDSWKAPEHYQGTRDMERDMRRWVDDESGYASKEPNLNRFNLVLDKRPTIMKPERKTYGGIS